MDCVGLADVHIGYFMRSAQSNSLARIVQAQAILLVIALVCVAPLSRLTQPVGPAKAQSFRSTRIGECPPERSTVVQTPIVAVVWPRSPVVTTIAHRLRPVDDVIPLFPLLFEPDSLRAPPSSGR